MKVRDLPEWDRNPRSPVNYSAINVRVRNKYLYGVKDKIKTYRKEDGTKMTLQEIVNNALRAFLQETPCQ